MKELGNGLMVNGKRQSKIHNIEEPLLVIHEYKMPNTMITITWIRWNQSC